jgi:glutaredoxin
MVIVLGADWCEGCKSIRKKLTKHDIEHSYVRIPPGQEGWDMVEFLTGRRAVPAIMYKFGSPSELNHLLKESGSTERELTQDEIDEFD